MHKIYLLLLPLLFLTGCKDKTATENNAATPPTQQQKKADIRLALQPNADCLPFYYAAERGYFEKAGIHVDLLTFASQTDCDTALAGNTVDGGFRDKYRHTSLGKKAGAYYQWLSTEGAWGIVASPQSRIKAMKGLSGKTIAYDRNTAAEHFMYAAVKEGGATGVMYPQINSLRVRASMVEESQVDAAVLPEPYLAEAVEMGCTKVYSVPGSMSSTGHLLIRQSAMQNKGFHAKMEKLTVAYNQAVDSLTERGVKDILPMLQRIYGISPDIAKKIKLPHYNKKTEKAKVQTQTSKTKK